MKCIFLFGDAPLSANFSGAASRHLGSFLALKRLGVEVHVWRFLSENTREKVLAHETGESAHGRQFRRQADSWTDVVYPSTPPYRTRLELLQRATFQPVRLAFPETGTLLAGFVNALQGLKPDFLWAESGAAGALAASQPFPLPYVYAQTDFHHRIFQLRRQARSRRPLLSEQIHEWAVRRGEMRIIRKATVITTGSQTEADELRRAGGRYVLVIPTTYEEVELDRLKPQDGSPARILHLGGLRTTSNYLGLMAYLDKVQSHFEAGESCFQLHVIGDTTGAKPELMERLFACKAVLHGHVDDLSSILRPFDIAIIPYEHDTGTRTKLSLLFNHAQVVVAARPAVAGSPELVPGGNCIVLPELEAFAKTLPALVQDRELRERVGCAAKKTFENEFTLEAQLPRFGKVLEHLA
ncbi:glycosyltransferase family 4 protein [Chloroflexi bacterium CFX6]|nr:glycosyltransferase family 4 protein [Chloroflexi bacterium CFX6]